MARIYLNIDILKRFLTSEQLVELEKGYDSNKKSLGNGKKLQDHLAKPVTEDERALLSEYLNADSIQDLVVKHHLSADSLSYRIKTIGLRALKQKIQL